MNKPQSSENGGLLEIAKKEVKSSLRNDLLGVDEWKRSKIGFLTGYSAARKTGTSIFNLVAGSQRRLGLLFNALRQPTRVVEGLEDPKIFDTGRERFIAAQKLQKISDTTLKIIKRNTFWSFWLYACIASIYISLVTISLFAWPLSSYLELLGRLGPSPLLLALMLKSAYTNWVVRRRSADEFSQYLLSCEWLPARN